MIHRIIRIIPIHAVWISTNEPYDKEHIKSILGYREGGYQPPLKVFSLEEERLSLPEDYDVHKKYPDCASEINDQSTCGSCWAVSSAETMSDRECLNGNKKLRLSELDILACCPYCGFGCNGGYPASAWVYFAGVGIVDGGPFGDKTHCTQYPFPPCSHHVKDPSLPKCGDSKPTPACPMKCQNEENWTGAKHADLKLYQIYLVKGEDKMKKDLVANGPITVAFTVYADFPTYKSGVYEVSSSESLGGHAVECVGYGSDGGKPYWRIKNSWNDRWGENGYFRIIRGRNECGIEASGVAGTISNTSRAVEIIV